MMQQNETLLVENKQKLQERLEEFNFDSVGEFEKELNDKRVKLTELENTGKSESIRAKNIRGTLERYKPIIELLEEIQLLENPPSRETTPIELPTTEQSHDYLSSEDRGNEHSHIDAQEKIVIQPNTHLKNILKLASMPDETQTIIADDKKLRELILSFNRTLTELPECAEKSLILLLLHFDNEDLKSTFDTNDIALMPCFISEQNVQQVWLIAKNQLTQESLNDRFVKCCVSELDPLFSSESLENSEIVGALLRLVKYLQPLDLDLMLGLIDQASKAEDKIRDKEVIQLLGGTGTGKSTTIHFLAGSTLETTVVEGIDHIASTQIINPDVESFITSPYARSETRIINAINIPLSSLDSSTTGEITVCDSPGFDDTGGAEIDIANGIGVVRALRGCRSVKPVILISGDSIGARFEGLVRLATILSALIPNLDTVLPSFSYIFTKFKKDQQRGIVAKLENKKRELKSEERANKGFVALFADIIKKARKQALILDPIHDSPIDIINALSQCVPINNPHDTFHDFVTPDSMAKLKDQLYKHKTSIEQALSRVDIPLLIFKIRQLAQVNHALSLHESRKYYETCIEGTTKLIEELQSQISHRLTLCIEPGNTQVSSDIIHCSQRMRDLFQLEPVRAAYLTELGNLEEYVVMHITHLQEQLKMRIQLNLDNNSDIQGNMLGVLVDLNKMKLVADIYSQTFCDMNGADNLVNQLYDAYRQACENLKTYFFAKCEAAQNELKINDFNGYVDHLDVLMLLKRDFVLHLSDIPMQENYMALIDAMNAKCLQIKENLEKCLVLKGDSELESEDIETVKLELSQIDLAAAAPNLFNHYPEQQLLDFISELEQMWVSFFEKFKVKMAELSNNKEKIIDFSELYKVIIMLDACRQNSHIAHVSNRTYQDIVRSIKDEVNAQKEIALHYLKLLAETQLGTELPVDNQQVHLAVIALQKATIFEGHPETIYHDEFKQVCEVATQYIDSAAEYLSRQTFGLDEPPEELKLASKVIQQMRGLLPIESYIFSDKTPLTDSLSVFESCIDKVFDEIKEIFALEKKMPTLESLIKVFNFIILTSHSLSEEKQLENLGLQSLIKNFIQSRFLNLTQLLEKVYENVFNELKVDISEALIQAQFLVSTLVFLLEMGRSHERLSTFTMEANLSEFVSTLFTELPNTILNRWLSDASSSHLCCHIQLLLGLAEQIEEGANTQSPLDLIKIAEQLRALDKYLPEGHSYAQVIVRLEAAMRTQSLTISNELQLLLSTGKYTAFKSRYDEVVLANPELKETLGPIALTLKHQMTALIERTALRVNDITINEANLESLQSIIVDLCTLSSLGLVLQTMLGLDATNHVAEVESVNAILLKKIDQYEAELSNAVQNCKFKTVENNLSGLKTILKFWQVVDGNSFNQEYHDKMTRVLSNTQTKLDAGLLEKVSYYSKLPFEQYPKEPPLLLMNALSDAREVNSDYTRYIEELNQAILNRIRGIIERATSEAATAEDEQAIAQILQAKVYLPIGFDDSYAADLKAIEENSRLRNEQLKQVLQESINTGDFSKLVEELSNALQTKDYSIAKLINDSIQQAIKLSADAIAHAVSHGDIGKLTLHIPNLWQLARDYSACLNKSLGLLEPRYAESFKVEFISSMLDKIAKNAADQWSMLFGKIGDSVKPDRVELRAFRQLAPYWDTLAYLANLMYCEDEKTLEKTSCQGFKQAILKQNVDFDKQLSNVFVLIVEFITAVQQQFLKGFNAERLTSLRETLEAYQDHAELIQKMIDFGATATAKNLNADAAEAVKSALSYPQMKARLSERLLELQKQVKVPLLYHVELSTPDQSQRDQFYTQLYNNFSSLSSAHLLAAHTDSAVAEVSRMENESKTHLQCELDKLKAELLILLKRMPAIDKAVYSDFSTWLDNLRSFSENFSEASLSQHAISLQKEVDRAFEDHIKELREAMVAESEIETIAQKLTELKAIGLSVPRYLKKVNREIDIALLTITKSSNGAQRIATLGLLLRQVEGEDQDTAIRVINDHSAFEGYAVSIRNEKTLRYKPEQVLADLRGDTINRIKLKSAIEEHEKQYWQLVENGLTRVKEAKLNLIKEAKNIATSSASYGEKVIQLSAYLFAYWTLDNSTRYMTITDLAESAGIGDTHSERNYLLQPHCAQVLSIFRLLGMDVDSADTLQHHMVQIGTGEGKSVTLAITASVLALLGYEIDCVCYSEYLSKRDFTAFVNLFADFDLLEYIHYNTFNNLSEQLINQHGDIRNLVLSHVEGRGVPVHPRLERARERILLIDEVDVFFSPDFYGNSYRPLAQLQDQTISRLIEWIWEHRDDKSSLTFESIKANTLYTNCVSRFSGWEFLIENAAKEMLADIKTYQEHDYIVSRDRIAYKDQDGISFDISYGYKTVFAYFKAHAESLITRDSRDAHVSITFDCGIFSYAEIPRQYQCIMGVTGTLETLSKSEKQILHSYGIQKSTYMPSVYGANQLEFAGNSTRDAIIESRTGYFTAIGNEISVRLNGKSGIKRSVLVFFNDRTSLDEFYRSTVLSDLGLKDKVRIITEQVSNDEKEGLIAQATATGNVTLLTRDFGRGTDFKCYDERLNGNGGVHVLQTFVSDSLSEETQIKGRTARQGNLGSYSLVLLDVSLERFGITNVIIEEMRSSGKIYDTINSYRQAFFDRQFPESIRHLESIRDDHEAAQQFIREALLPGNVDAIKNFLCSFNKTRMLQGTGGVAREPSRTICLMDATGSMGGLIAKAKHTVATTFERACEILKQANMPVAFELQFAVYRNYDQPVAKLLQVSGWESDPRNLEQFMSTITACGGTWLEEAIEIALWHANHTAEKMKVDQVILIGDAPPNSRAQVLEGRRRGLTENYWRNQEDFKEATYVDEQVMALKQRKIPVHAFYVADKARESFEKIASMTKGESARLDIDSPAGAEKLTDLITKRILNSLGGEMLVSMYDTKYGHLGSSSRSQSAARPSGLGGPMSLFHGSPANVSSPTEEPRLTINKSQ